jgi:hypothetical protein
MNHKDIPQQPQDQRALNDQLRRLAQWASRLGMYDAADYLNTITKPPISVGITISTQDSD